MVGYKCTICIYYPYLIQFNFTEYISVLISQLLIFSFRPRVEYALSHRNDGNCSSSLYKNLTLSFRRTFITPKLPKTLCKIPKPSFSLKIFLRPLFTDQIHNGTKERSRIIKERSRLSQASRQNHNTIRFH